ncbi:MAG TPA: DUF6134 family protein [Candidatus Cybelea sp.]|nr:DUF6134 family protein [Candidatus Cybelea sp.]
MLICTRIATAFALISTAGFAAAAPAEGDWPGRAGRYVFDITRDGSAIGTQSIDVAQDGDKTIAVTESTVAVKMLGVTVYRMHQVITETYQGQKLVALVAETKDPDGLRTVQLARDGDHWSGLLGKKAVAFDCDCLASTMWQAASIAGPQIIEASQGKLQTITVEDRGSETLDLPEGRVLAHHLSVKGGIEREVWYDAAGNLVAAQQVGRDGSLIRQTLVSDPAGAQLSGAQAAKPTAP